MSNKQSNRKLLYPAGLLSLSLLPFFVFVFYYQADLKKESQHCKEVTYWNPKDRDLQNLNPLKYVNDKFTKIKLTGTSDDKIKLDFLQIAVRELHQEKDTTRGIEITFEKGSKYSSLIRVFDICEIEGIRAYLNYEEKFWIFNFPPSAPKSSSRNSSICGTNKYRRIINPPQPEYAGILLQITDQPQLAGASMFLFIMLASLAGHKILQLKRSTVHI